MSNPTLATIALGSCEGCHVSLIDTHEGLLDLLGAADLVFSPFSGPDDFPAQVDVVLVEGAVANEHDRERLLEARKAATILVALGSCAVLGGIGGLRNLSTLAEVFQPAFGDTVGDKVGLPKLEPHVLAVADVVDVDFSLPGCSPKPERIAQLLTALVTGQPFEPPRRNLCDECHREKKAMLEHSKEFVADNVTALMELDTIDPTACFLEQGVLCMGAVTVEGCGARCTAANVPCRGCNGPSRLDFEQGGKAVDTLAAVLPAGGLMFMEDLIGTAYRFSMPVSIFPTIREGEEADADV